LILPWFMALLPALGRAFASGRSAFRAVATHFWCACLSVARIFHVPDVDDLGFALLTGGVTAASRATIWNWMGHVTRKATRLFQRLTEPPAQLAKTSLMLSLDAHAVPCWTRKYAIPKGYHTCRNKHMKIEQLYYFYDLKGECLLRLVATAGDVDLRHVMVPETKRLMRDTGAARARILVDAAASKDEDALLELMALEGVEVLARAVRKQNYMKQWRAIPQCRWAYHEEPNEVVGRPPDVLEVANTTTGIGSDDVPVRTVVAREYHGRNKKECYHVLFTNVKHTPAVNLIREFRRRQNHEQAYRVGVNDLNLDAITHAYVKDSDPGAPDFDPARLDLVGWLKALAFNAFQEFRTGLPEPFSAMQAGSLIRHFVLRPGRLYATADEFIVAIEPFRNRPALDGYIEKLNAQEIRIPWLGGRRLRVTFAPAEPRISGSELASLLVPKYIRC
jgi:hypothetical protein